LRAQFQVVVFIFIIIKMWGIFFGFSPLYEKFCAQIFVVSGETGCGKTTQVPQYILEEAIKAG
jgi:cytochrome c oxidase assembly protein Cox11